MKRTLTFLYTVILLSTSCSKSKFNVDFDFITELPSAQVSVSVDKFEPLLLWEDSLKVLGWGRNKKLDKKGILIPSKNRRAFLRSSSIGKEKKIAFDIKPLISKRNGYFPRLQIFLNGRKLISTPLDWEGYRKLDAQINDECLFIGENFLEFQLSPLKYEMNDRFWIALESVELWEPEKFTSPVFHPEQTKIQVITEKGLFRKGHHSRPLSGSEESG